MLRQPADTAEGDDVGDEGDDEQPRLAGDDQQDSPAQDQSNQPDKPKPPAQVSLMLIITFLRPRASEGVVSALCVDGSSHRLDTTAWAGLRGKKQTDFACNTEGR